MILFPLSQTLVHVGLVILAFAIFVVIPDIMSK
jgi:hypothetical protein